MAAVTGTVWSVATTVSDAVTPVQQALVLFTCSGTYAQADNGILAGVAALISASRRNGKTCTLLGCMIGQPASNATDLTKILGLKTVAISTADITFEITDNDYTTEFADATALTAQSRPFGIVVAFTEA